MFGNRRAVAPKAESAATAPDAGHQALCFLVSQGLPPTPENYALAWQAKVERHGLIAMAVDAILLEGRAVLAGDVARIMSAAVKPAAPAGEHDPQKSALRHQTLKLADLAAIAAASSMTFERDLSDGLHDAGGGEEALQHIVGTMIGRTRIMEEQLGSASREIESLRQEVEAVRDDAHRDALTGLLNRRGAMQELSGRRRKGGAVTLAICDVDHFKSVNDRFGHGVGDRVLRGVAASLSESCEDHQVARWGGEEFVVVLDGLGMEQAAVVLDRARSNLAARTFRLRRTDEPLGSITMSIGAASLQGGSVADAIDLADARLYAAKREGRNRLVTDGAAEPA